MSERGICEVCHQYDAPENLRVYTNGSPNSVRAIHRVCIRLRPKRGRLS